MRKIDNYIFEKLHISKGMKKGDDLESLASNIMTFIDSENKVYYQSILQWLEDNNAVTINVHISTSDYDKNLSGKEKELLPFKRHEILYEHAKTYFKYIKHKAELIVNQKFPFAQIKRADDILEIVLKKFKEPIYIYLKSYISEKLHISKGMKPEVDNIQESIQDIVDNLFGPQKIKYSINLDEKEKGKFIQVNIVMNDKYKEYLVDDWCIELCNRFEKELEGWFWCSRSTNFDNPKQSMMVILLGKVERKKIKL